MLTRTTLTHLLLPAPTCPATGSSQCGLDAPNECNNTDLRLQRGPILSSSSGDIALAGRARVRQQVHALKAILQFNRASQLYFLIDICSLDMGWALYKRRARNMEVWGWEPLQMVQIAT